MRWIILLLPLLIAATPIEPRWHWDDSFTKAERDGLQEWIRHNLRGLHALVGKPGQPMHVHFRRARANEPVPWANTWKSDAQRVYFHVDTSHPWSSFRTDWTAPHELVHLLFPYLGEDSRWFAEGVASYLQYQVMYASGEIEWEEAIDRYRERFDAARSSAGRTSIVQQSGQKGRTHYVQLYWGGAAYFLHADRRLFERRGLRLHQLIGEYVRCCQQRWGADAPAMIRQLDQISRSDVFSSSFAETVNRPGFPATHAAMDWLASHPPATDQPPEFKDRASASN